MHNLHVSRKGENVPPNKDTNGFAKTFPQRLMDMISYKGSQGIISWTMEGNAFIIMDETLLSKQLLTIFFKKTKYLSFIRKINRWGFKRVLTGENTGAFYHESFLRDQPQRCLLIDCHHPLATCSERESKKEVQNDAMKNSTLQKTEASGSDASSSVQKHTEFSPSLVLKFPRCQLNTDANAIDSSFCYQRTASEMSQLMNMSTISWQQQQQLKGSRNGCYDAHTRRILSNSVLAKSRYHDKARFKSQLLGNGGPANDAIAQPHLYMFNTDKKLSYTAYDIANAKLMLSSRHQDTADIRYLANKLSPTNAPRMKNNIAARLA